MSAQSLPTLPSIPEEKVDDSRLIHPINTPVAPAAPVNAPTYIVVRDTAYLNMTEEFLNQSGLHLDGDVYQTSPQGYTPVRKNHNRFVTDSSFFRDGNTVGAASYDADSLENLASYLYSEGKMPRFLGLKLSEDGRVCVVARRNIAPQTYLGKFEGTVRPTQTFAGKPWCRVMKGFNREDVAVIDADNITFSNWTRYLSPSAPEKANCSFNPVNYSILVFCDKPIKKGDELLSVN